MKIKILLLLLSCFAIQVIATHAQPAIPKKSSFSKIKNTNRTSGAFTYSLAVFSEPYVDLTGGTSVNNGDIWDDPAYTIPIGFPFELNGNTVTFLTFYGTGSLFMGNGTNPDIATFVFPYENDILDRGEVSGVSESPISYLLEGTSPNRIFKMEIKNAGSYYEFDALGTTDMFFNHQLWLYEGSNQIEFRYGPSSIDDPDLWYADGGALIGVTNVDVINDEFVDGHFIGGPASAPILYANDVTIEGTPDEDVVYRLSLPLPLEVFVTGINSTSSCEPNGSATAEASGGTPPYSFEWSNGETTSTINNLDGGTYTVTVTDAIGAFDTGSVTITNIGPVTPNAFTTDETSVDANDGTATSAAFGGSPPYDYEWSNGENTQTISNLAPGDYTVTVTDSDGCTASQTVTVNSFECADLELEVVLLDASCFGVCDGSIEIVNIFGATPPYTYIWSNGLSSANAFDLCAGEYSVTILDANGCVINGGPFAIAEPPVLLANTSSTNETAIDANDGTARVDPTGGTLPYTFLWNNGSPDPIQTNLAPGIYGVTVSDAHGCIDSQQVEVLEFICTGVIDPIVDNQSCYFTCDGAIDIELTGGVGPLTFLWSTGEIDFFIENLCEGTYSVIVTDVGANCTYQDTFDIIAPDTSEFTIDQILHYNNFTAGAISITYSGGTPPYTYEWTGPNGYTSSEEDISGLVPGLYTVIIADANNCTSFPGPIEILDETVSTNHVANLYARVYPNPADEQLFIDIENVSSFRIELISLDGRTIKIWDGERILEIGDFPAGIYVLEGVSEAGVFRKQISIQN